MCVPLVSQQPEKVAAPSPTVLGLVAGCSAARESYVTTPTTDKWYRMRYRHVAMNLRLPEALARALESPETGRSQQSSPARRSRSTCATTGTGLPDVRPLAPAPRLLGGCGRARSTFATRH